MFRRLAVAAVIVAIAGCSVTTTTPEQLHGSDRVAAAIASGASIEYVISVFNEEQTSPVLKGDDDMPDTACGANIWGKPKEIGCVPGVCLYEFTNGCGWTGYALLDAEGDTTWMPPYQCRTCSPF